MADINPVQGPFGPKEDPHKRDLKKMGTPEKFKETYRVQAIGEADAEAKKKRKRPEEQVDTPPSTEVGPVTPGQKDLEPSPFSPQKPEVKVSSKGPISSEQPTPSGSYYTPSAPSSQGEGDALALPTPPTSQTPPPQETASAAPSPAAETPSPTEEPPAVTFSEDDLFTNDEDLEPEEQEPANTASPTATTTTTSTNQQSATTQSTQPGDTKGQPTVGAPPVVKTDKITKGEPSSGIKSPKESKEELKTQPGDTKGQPTVGALPVVKTEKIAKEEPSAGIKSPKESKEELKTTLASPMSAPKEKTEGPYPSAEDKPSSAKEEKPMLLPEEGQQQKPLQITPEMEVIEENQMTPLPSLSEARPATTKESKAKDLSSEELSLSWDDTSSPVSAISSESTGQDKGEHKDKKEEETASTVQPLQADVAPFALQGTPGTEASLPSYTSFSPALLEMFDKMVGTITVLQESSGERTTTITLTSENFSSSPFYGAQIVIEEDLHLAPGQYNIKLLGSPEATALFQSKTDDLLAAFQSGNYTFKVQRIETAIQSTEKPLFHRKEEAGGEAGADAGGGEKQ